ncbi:MAG: hypothetical protein KF746_17635 [Chitinophagaceae bacterium]|nr:hypothetical protein [Chitinophagaceae bacterium]
MPRIDSVSCEPFRAWNRLEPRTRKQDFDDVLKCAIHDPLWMLTRQWQFGEFQGEDTGSAIFAKIKMQSTQITRYKSATESGEVYTDVIPAETKVESEHPRLDYHCRVQSASFFMKLLKNKLTGAAGFDYAGYLQKLRTLYALVLPESVDTNDNHINTVLKLRTLVNNPLNSFLAANGTQWFDGALLYNAAKAGLPAAATAIALVDPGHTDALKQALEAYVQWFEKTYKPQHNTNGKGAWLNEQMEYQFAVALPEKEKPNTVLKAEEYYTGDMEWYSFDVSADGETIEGLTGNATDDELPKVDEKIVTVIPTLAKYGGMPHPRWWQFEDGNIDLGDIDADTTDIAKLIVSEYALIYGNDWLVVPYSLPVGSLTQIPAIVITDVFGERSLVKPAIQGNTDDWTAWGLFNLSVRTADNMKNAPADTRLFLPPCVAKTQESEPLEEIHFIRDEMANMVWAIETRMNSLAGINMAGDAAANYLRNAIELIEPPAGTLLPVDEKAMFKYMIENTVPENWIPFVPVHIPGQYRAVRLQRASMPRWFKKEYAPVRPATSLLRTGINETDAVTSPMFVNEEEVPRAGARVTSNFQRTRWYNGKTVNWLGRRKKLGRGEGSSGLQFDALDPITRERK